MMEKVINLPHYVLLVIVVIAGVTVTVVVVPTPVIVIIGRAPCMGESLNPCSAV